MPGTKGHKVAGLFLALLLASLISACSLDTLPRAAATSLAQERTPAPTMVPDEPVRYTLILPGDNGASAPPVGCQDSIVRVNSGLTRTGVVAEDVAAALNVLFNAQAQAEGPQYANALYGQGLAVASMTLNGARLNVAIDGDLMLTGVCEDARMRAQLLQTIFQYGGFTEAFITIGGQNAKQLFDASGAVPADAVYTRDEAT